MNKKQFLKLPLLLTATALVSMSAQAQDGDYDKRIEALKSKISALQSKQKSNENRINGFMKGAKDRINFTGFLSVGLSQFNKDSVNSYTYGQKQDLSLLPNSWVGFQVNTKLYESGELIVQLLGQGQQSSANNDSFDIDTEWLYLKQDLGAGFNAQIGRIRFPAFADSEVQYIGNTYPWIRPPAEVYSVLPLSNIDGVSVNHQAFLGDWTIDSKALLWGEATVPSLGSSLTLENTRGLVVNAGLDALSLRFGVFKAKETININARAGDGLLTSNLSATFGDELTYYTSGIRYDNSVVYASAEGVQIVSDKDILDENRNWNLTLGYYIGDLLVYAGQSKTNVTNPSEMAANLRTVLAGNTVTVSNSPFPVPASFLAARFLNRHQNTYLVGAKYDISSKTSLKFQAQFLNDFENTQGNFGNTGSTDFKDIWIYDIAIQSVF